jgi:hypothetical protein
MIASEQQFRALLLALAIAGACVLGLSFSPRLTQAFPFGGQASLVQQCVNGVTYLMLGPPVGGPYILSPTTLRYDFKTPPHVGQWFLGIAGAPDFCVVSVFPTVIFPGTYISMTGSSQ